MSIEVGPHAASAAGVPAFLPFDTRPPTRGNQMDLITAVAVSMLPVSRLKAARAFKELRASDPSVALEQVLEAAGPPGEGLRVPAALELARSRATTALAAASTQGF